VREAIFEELSGENVVARVGSDLGQVAGAAERFHAELRHPPQRDDELVRHDLSEQFFLTGEVLVDVADRRAGAFGHVGHRRRLEPRFGEERSRRRHHSRPHVFLRPLRHIKENI
jgi:hypothetical protein